VQRPVLKIMTVMGRRDRCPAPAGPGQARCGLVPGCRSGAWLLDGDDPLELWAVVDEAAIRRVVGGPVVMRDQLSHVLDVTRRPNVTVQVITFDSGAHPGMPGPFVHMEFRDKLDPELVYIDTLAGDIFLEADEDIRWYRDMFDHLRAGALSPADSARLIASVRDGWK
jgi:Domain of unknown function (DUF5753)